MIFLKDPSAWAVFSFPTQAIQPPIEQAHLSLFLPSEKASQLDAEIFVDLSGDPPESVLAHKRPRSKNCVRWQSAEARSGWRETPDLTSLLLEWMASPASERSRLTFLMHQVSASPLAVMDYDSDSSLAAQLTISTGSRRTASRHRRRVNHPQRVKPLTKAQVLELVSHAVELELGQELNVKYDVKLPELATGNLRQVDSAIYAAASGRDFLRIVEVQDRATKVGAPFVDQVAAKVRSLGAHRATLVSAAGFTKGALDKIRIEHSALIDARTLRLAEPHEWPPLVKMRVMKMRVNDSEPIEAPIVHRTYADPLTSEIIFNVLHSNFSAPELSQVGVYLIDPKKPPPGMVAAFTLGRTKGRLDGANLTVNFTKASGEKGQLREQAKPFPL